MTTAYSFRTRLIASIGLTALVLLLISFATTPARAEPSDPELADWGSIYLYWTFGDVYDAGVLFDTDARDNTTVAGVVLMPLPDTPGDGTPGSIDVTLNSRESFYLPLWTILGTSYTDGTPPDEFLSLNVFKTLDISLKIDGAAVVTANSVMDYYAKGEFAPAIPFGAFGIDSIIWFQGISILHAPLSPGKHTITLDVKNTIPAFGSISEYHNTWNVNVKRK